jgi:hypothetical protein
MNAQSEYSLFNCPPPKIIMGDRDGETFNRARDIDRLDNAMGRIYSMMKDGKWYTLAELSSAGECSEACASARFRDLSKPKFRGPNANWTTQKEHVSRGLWHYRLVFEVA